MEQLDSSSFREVMGRYPTGVTVVTSVRADGSPVGLTVNSFTSVSLDPPLILVCIDKKATSRAPIIEAGRFAVTILADDQEPIAHRFAFDPGDSRFEEVDWLMTPGGSPILEGASAWLECAVEQVVTAGDHSVVIGRVVDARALDKEPLVFHAGAYGRTGG